MGSVILNWVPELQSVLTSYRKRGLKEVVFDVLGLPPSLNHHHKPVLRISRAGKRYIGQRLSDEAKGFREAVFVSLLRFRGHSIMQFPDIKKVPAAAVVAFESPRWVCKNGKARCIDIDNLTKELFDAIQLATGLKDELIWHVHAFKVASEREITTVHLFSLGGTMLA